MVNALGVGYDFPALTEVASVGARDACGLGVAFSSDAFTSRDPVAAKSGRWTVDGLAVGSERCWLGWGDVREAG